MPAMFWVLTKQKHRGHGPLQQKKARRESGLILETWRVFTQSYFIEKPIFWSVDKNSVRAHT